MGELSHEDPSPFGAKVDTVMRLLQDIRRKREQAILFVQFEDQLAQVQRALTHYDIDGIVVESAAAAGSQLREFQDSSHKATKRTVIVLDASSETAAGSNLQNANHVIFMSPLLRESQYGYESTMAQALGRVRRFGQSRPIHVYRVVAIDTIDVDILEHRERRVDALIEQDGTHIEAPPAAAKSNIRDEPRAERMRLVREDGKFSLRPKSWLAAGCVDDSTSEVTNGNGKGRVQGWEDFSSLVKFSSTFTEDDE
ncbi:putative helicase, P-loop containing nucleoside triphosphate hydrolase [Septoria linicola]|nr:putative helicase, P-loop containing nucleoside triphosphate hydrolase [Septoria linicola]